MNLATHLHLVQKFRMVALYLLSRKRLHFTRSNYMTSLFQSSILTTGIFGEEYMLCSSYFAVFSNLLSLSALFSGNLLLYTLFSNTLTLSSFLNITDQISHPYKKMTKVIIFYILRFAFLDGRRGDWRFWTDCMEALTQFNVLFISSL